MVLFSKEELDRLKDKRVKSSISVLKAPKFWKLQSEKTNWRTNLHKWGGWAFVHDDDYKLSNDCNISCNNDGRAFKLYVMKTDQGIVRMNKLCK